MPTASTFDLTHDEVRRRKAYLQITPDDERALVEARPLLARHAPRIVGRFYEFLLAHPQTRTMLEPPGVLERVQKLQAEYFHDLTSGDYGLAYFERRLRVGATHNRAGLAPEWYLGAYNRYLQIVSDILREELAADLPRYDRTVAALTRLVFLDMSLALDAYIHAAQQSLEARSAALEIANAELRRAQAARQSLTDMIVHDLQNPLAGIRAWLDLLGSRAGALTAAEEEGLAEARRRCDDLGQLILNVLQVSRAEAGKLDVALETVDLAELARQSVAAFRLVAERDGKAIELAAPAALPVRTDPNLLRRVLDNLLRNALRHNPRGTRVQVRAEPLPTGGARLLVADDGPGIPAEAQPLLFERFGAPALRDSGRRVDSGLGLAFCRTALDALGGSIRVESDGVRGSAFRIELGA